MTTSTGINCGAVSNGAVAAPTLPGASAAGGGVGLGSGSGGGSGNPTNHNNNTSAITNLSNCINNNHSLAGAATGPGAGIVVGTIGQPQQQQQHHRHQKLSDLSNNNGSSSYISNSNNTSSCSTTSSSAKDVVGGGHYHHHHRHHHHNSSSSERPSGTTSGRPGNGAEHSVKLYSQTLTPSTRKKGSLASNTLASKGSPYCTSAASCCSNLMHLSLDESNLASTAASDGGSIKKNRTPTLKTIGMSQSLHHQPLSSSSNLVKTASNGAANGDEVPNGSGSGAGAPAVKPSYSPMQVLMMFGNKLSPYEYREILDYKRIYFIGNAATGQSNAEGGTANGSGGGGSGSGTTEKTDKSRDKEAAAGAAAGDASTADKRKSQVIENFTPASHDHVAYRYEVLKLIGKGSFGVVYKAYDHKYGRFVALKMVRNERRFHRQAQEEIKILEYLRRMDNRNEFNVIHMHDHFIFRQQMFITFELLYINLFELIRKNKFCGFSIQVVRKFAHSLLICLNALHNQKIIHCDLKPENILLKQQGRSGIKVSDREINYSSLGLL